MNCATVGFVYNQPCPLKCDFCCHTTDVVGPGRACPENITPVVLCFAALPSVRRFAFTGGDPFLYIDEIIAIMRTARAAGVTQPFNIVTSGYWAKSAEGTESLLATLHELGMDVLSVSYDKQHARWVSPQQIEWIADACKRCDIGLSIHGIFWTGEEKVEDLLPNVADVPMHSDLVVSIGRARDKVGEAPRYAVPDEVKFRCHKPRNYDLTIYPNGDVYPCCSGGFNKEAKLLCGNAFTDSAEEILAAVYGNFHARIAKEIGFDVLYSQVEQSRPDLMMKLSAFSSVDSVCQICRNLRTDPEVQQALQPIYEQMEIDYVLSCVDEHEAGLNLFSGHSANPI
jgi:Radical SAM superfamily/4Fe-4S single cluster domain/Iron-sulfur cluster-binding domain